MGTNLGNTEPFFSEFHRLRRVFDTLVGVEVLPFGEETGGDGVDEGGDGHTVGPIFVKVFHGYLHGAEKKDRTIFINVSL